MSDDVVGRTIDGRYHVTQRLAHGGMATVYLATDTRLDRQVALKVMHAHLATDESFRERFYREAKSAASISHPGIVSVFDQGRDGNITYLAMEYVPGCTLREVIQQQSPMSLRRSIAIIEQVLEGVGAAHSAGLVHRDLKPENVLVSPDGRVKVADFGLARAAQQRGNATTGVVMGTIAYVAPEVVNEKGADERTDVYALGVILFELLTGKQPFTGENAIAVAYKHVKENFPLPSGWASGIPHELDELVLWATAKDPAERPENAWEFLADLKQIRAGLPDAQLDARPVPSDGTTQPVVSQKNATRAMPGGAYTPLPVDGDPEPAYIEPPVARRSPRRHSGQAWTAIFVSMLVVLALIAGGVWYALVGPGAYTTAPAVTSLTLQEAESKIASAGLSIDVSEEYNEDVPAGQVFSASPASGERVRKSGEVRVVVSKGSAFVSVPDLNGLTEDAARKLLADSHLALGSIDKEYSDSIDVGSVISQAVSAGEQTQRDSRIDITVSKGREPLTVLDVTGREYGKAKGILEEEGFVVEKKTSYSDSVKKGVVMSQSPASGDAFRGDTITLTVSAGPDEVKVPNVYGKTPEEATKILEDAGFTVKVEEFPTDFFNAVQRQSPAPGSKVKSGSTVTITIW